MSRIRTLVLVAAVLLLTALSAAADTYSFNLSNGTHTYAWQLNSQPSPSSSTTGARFILSSVGGTADGSPFTFDYMSFYNSASSGGLKLENSNGTIIYANATGAQLYTGAESAPTFVLGSFNLSDVYQGPTWKLDITDASTGVPEPSSLLLLASGAGLLFRRRK